MPKIPKEAKKVFSGVIFDVYQWQQKQFDGSFATYEMIKRPNTLAAIVTQGDRVLIAREQQPTKALSYGPFAGKQELDEEPLDGMKRELKEETGMVSDSWEFFKTYDITHKIEWYLHMFIVRDAKKITEPELEPGEKIEVVDVSFDEFVQIASSEDFWIEKFSFELCRLRLEQNKLEAFRKKLFPNP